MHIYIIYMQSMIYIYIYIYIYIIYTYKGIQVKKQTLSVKAYI